MATARRRLIIGFTVPSVVVAVFMHATAAQASPTITIGSPPAGQPLYDLRPTITVAYTSDDPAAPLNLATLRVTVNGFDWTGKFTAGPDSATYAVTVDDELIAGALTIAASISDTAGASASAAGDYDVFPTLSALAPSTAEAGDTISLMASGLDPAPDRNKALLTPSGLTAALSDVDRSIATGRFTLPAGTTSGDVGLEVNGKVARERIQLSVPSVVPNCGGIRSLFATADGGWLVAYGADPFKPVDPQCPPAQLVDYLKWRFVKVTPAGELLPLPLPGGVGLGFDVRLIPNKRRSDAAILKRNFSLPVVVRYKDVDTFLPGFVSAADFDRDGNLFVLFFDSGFRIYRVSKEALAQGGDATLEPIAQLPVQSGGPVPYGFVVSCDGFAYAAFSLRLNQYPWVQPRIFKVDLAARAVVGDRLLGVGEELYSLALSCQTNELWSARFLNVQENTSAAIARTEVIPNGFGISEDVFVTPAAAFPIGVAIGVGGSLYFQTGTSAVLAKAGAINACAVPTGALPVCETLEEAIVSTPETTRWKPQRDTQKNIDVVFTGPKEILDPNVVTSVTLEIKDPTGAAVTSPTLSSMTVLDANSDPVKAQITWLGPWITTDPQGSAAYRPRGDYKVKIVATRKDGSRIESSESDPNSTVSLVEVTKVELLPADDDPRSDALTDNPSVAALSGQNPPQARPGGGKRIFAEAQMPGGTALNRVKVVATIDPPIPTQEVPVHFKPFDVDDPAGSLVDLDGDDPTKAPSDNRGMPQEGSIATTPVSVPAGQAKTAAVVFTVSTQPGDNYRVAASTSQSWLGDLQPAQPSQTGEIPVPDDSKGSISDMLTVWRSFHVEVAGMADPPTDPTAPERNFLQGNVTAVQASSRTPTKLTLSPDVTTPPLGLSDGSPDLSSGGGQGRFEKGTITVGTGSSAVRIGGLDGNGSDFVQKQAGIVIPFTLVDSAGKNPLSGTLMEWDSQARQFTLSGPIGKPIYDGGALTVGGVKWSVDKARGPRVTVVEDQSLPFVLYDDDIGPPVAPLPSIVPTDDLKNSDDPSLNPFAQAYVRPKHDIPEDPHPDFKRNFSDDDNALEVVRQLDRTRKVSSTPEYWSVYVQGAFQGDTRQDKDPDAEIGQTGRTIQYFRASGQFAGSSGSLVYNETKLDVEGRQSALFNICLPQTVLHEVGHQFSLGDNTGGVMDQGCQALLVFTPDALKTIRGTAPLSVKVTP